MKKMNPLKKNPPSLNAFRGGSYSLIISAVVLALLVVTNVFASALRNDKIRHQLYEIVLRYKQHKGSCERTGAGRDDLLDRSIRKRGRHH
ncbi:hypothetical protein [Ruthenibacterium lactatiformans]|uniref:hypothetical protein n=1 Tax=Ruthenibacterium lactatiformans TaxID=1550024 RepID=UPI001FC7CE1A|nr:hypothetical protein [Ruthenibacterium lactatiformans]